METSSIPLFFLHIAGAVALLIWSVRLVRTGVERAFSVQLRRWLRWSAKNSVLAASSGAGAAVFLQSATAVTILVTGFVSRGSIGAAAGLAVLLGADVGSAIATQLLLLRQSFLAPLLVLLGVALFLRGHQRKTRQSGRILIGLALIFLSLDMIREATAPLVGSENAAAVMAYLARDTLTAFVLGAGFAWLVHSSVAAILLVVTLVSQGVLPPSAAVAMVLGANLGSTLIAYFLTLSAPTEARRLIIANCILRGGGAGLVLLAFSQMAPGLGWLGHTPARQVINLHLVFNLALALLALPFAGIVVRLTKSLMKPQFDPSLGSGRPSALDPDALQTPERALTCAAREILHMGEAVESMLRTVNGLFVQWDDRLAATLSADKKRTRNLNVAIKLYLAKLDWSEMDDTARKESMELSTNAANLWAASETISRNMIGLARRLDQEGVRFSSQGWQEISDFHDHVLANVQLSLSVMMTQNPEEARALIEEKNDIREAEQTLQRRHLKRLNDGLIESIETSNIHQETLRALKQVNTFFSMVAHPILAGTGDLLNSRLANRV